VGVGALGLFLGVTMIASRLVRPLAKLVGGPARRGGGGGGGGGGGRPPPPPGTGEPGAPLHAADGLERLAAARLYAVPRLLGRGEVVGASWSAESALRGRRPRSVGPRLARQVTSLCLAFPRAEGPPLAIARDLETIELALPDRAGALRAVAAGVKPVVAALPAVLRHGDLWAGNLLVERGALTGVVDWDAWHPAAMPGTDLLRLFATEERRRAHLSLGRMWIMRPWRSERFLALSRNYWSALGVAPSDEVLDAVGIAWWASEIAGTLSRLPHRAADVGWLTANVDAVLAAARGRSGPPPRG
jgi:hypothetical protein